MTAFEFTSTDIPGLFQIKPFSFIDARGAFYKYFNADIFAEHGISFEPKEEFLSVSAASTLRGIHFQLSHSQDKLVHVVSGSILDVAVDLRPNSPSFGKWRAFNLSAENAALVYLPKLFGHGLITLEDNTAVHYLCGDVYDAASEGSIVWNDPDLGINWPLAAGEAPILSERDKNGISFAEFKKLTNHGAGE